MRKELWPDTPDDAPLQFHSHDYKSGCYCACPEGPCQHEWTGPARELGEGNGFETTCARCGMGAMSHDIRTTP